MCVIIYKPADEVIPERVLRACWTANSDGAGIAFPLRLEKRAYAVKGLDNVEDVVSWVEDFSESEMIVHFRIKSKGRKNIYQTHPFNISTDMGEVKSQIHYYSESLLFHNGTLTEFGNEHISDTAELAHKVLSHLPDEKTKVKLLEELPGKFILVEKGQTWIIGHFEKRFGCSFSNTFWESRVNYPVTPYSSSRTREIIPEVTKRIIEQTVETVTTSDAPAVTENSDGQNVITGYEQSFAKKEEEQQE